MARALVVVDPERAVRALAPIDQIPADTQLFPPVDLGALRLDAEDVVEAALALLAAQPSTFAAEAVAVPDLRLDPIAELRAEAWRVEARARAVLGQHELASARMARALEWYDAHDWPSGGRVDARLDLAELLLLRPETVQRADAVLGSLPPFGSDSYVDQARRGRAARLRARVGLSQGRAVEAFEVLQRAVEDAGCATVQLALDLDLASLPAAAATWETRATSAQRARDLCRRGLLVAWEGRALAVWARLLEEAGRADEARAARADARWIADRLRIPDPDVDPGSPRPSRR